MKTTFELQLPTRIIYGCGKAHELKRYIKGFGKSVFIVTGRNSVKQTGLLDQVLKQLKEIDVSSIVFNDIEPNPRSTTIDQAAKLLKENHCKYVMAIGGGSVMDAAKCIAMLSVNEGAIWDYMFCHGEKERRKFNHALPLVCIPTVAATSSETNPFAVVTNWEAHEKVGIFGNALYPALSIVDPIVTLSVPKQTTVDGAIDIISHVLEEYLSTNDQTPLQDGFSEVIMKTVMEYLPIVLQNLNDINARSQLMWASSLALSGFLTGRRGAWPIHAIEHTLSAHYDISHGKGLAILIPEIMRYDSKSNEAKLCRMGRNLFSLPITDSDENAEKVVQSWEQWMKSVGALAKLSDFGIDRAKFNIMADDILRISGTFRENKRILENIVAFEKNDLLKLFNDCL